MNEARRSKEIEVSHNEGAEVATRDVGDCVIAVLADTLSDLQDRLWADGFQTAADVVADLAYRCDRHLSDRD